MFWKKKKKQQESSREAVLKQAQDTMAAKRAEIGDEALEEIKSAILNRENSDLMKAKKQILSADEGKVRDNLNLWLRE